MRRSWQPEDNFRVLASCDSKFLNDAVNLDRDLQPPPGQTAPYHGLEIRIARATGAPLTLLPEHTSWQSEVLTVWRRLHLEVDSMAAPGNANTVNGQITNVVAGPGADESTVTTNQNLADQDQYQCPQGRYPTPCQLNTGGRPYNTRGNAMGANATVTMSLRDAQNNLQPAPTANQPFTLHDDDQDNVLPQPVAAPNAWLAWLQSSDLRTENLFADAYVRPILDGGGNAANNQTALPFSPNVEITIPVIRTQIAAGKQVTGDENFWVSYVQANFQGGRDHDNDPNGEVGFIPGIGLVGAIFGVTPVPGDASLIFVESYRDGCGGLTAVAGQREGVREVVIHEIGHQFRGDHPDGGIMGDYLQGTCMPPQSAFTDITLNRIRSIPRPGM